ncbi:MAG: FAD-dependent oxidoreductase, partial [Deltaproteobacteria bacterium]|nr:FAD-dependent oxidoreductase [Deltaproteobacteria bacterium]
MGSGAVLVLGAGIAGLQTAIDAASLGLRVHLVERAPSIGGRMAQLDKTFPTNDCSLCILAPKMIECAGHPLVTLHTSAALVRLEGAPGRFRAVVRRRSRYVRLDKCTGCGECTARCPVELPSELDAGLGPRKAIYKPFPQAVPNAFSITKLGTPPCQASCPARINAAGYVQLAKLGKLDEALGTIHETTPFAGTLGRICPRPCETSCARAEREAAVGIAALKRAAADLGHHQPGPLPEATAHPERARRKVAVVGSGPAGLTAAYQLARRGYAVTVFEKLPAAGGMLRVGVPAYRLPREVLDAEIELVRALGVEIRTGAEVRSLRALRAQGFAAVFLATGAHRSLALGVPGERLRGVVGAVELLRRVALGRKVAAGKAAVVVGGGNAAIDAARTLLRLGSREVTVLYRRTRTQMPALPWEIEAALAEGVRLETLAAPVRVVGRAGRIAALEVIRMQLGAPDASGRPRPVPVPGSEHRIACDMVVPAIGQAPELGFVDRGSRIQVSRSGTIVADRASLATAEKGIFAGGDLVSGPATAVEAVAAGCRAAGAIHRYLPGLPAE